MEAALETGGSTTTARLFLRATLWTLLIPSLFGSPADGIPPRSSPPQTLQTEWIPPPHTAALSHETFDNEQVGK